MTVVRLTHPVSGVIVEVTPEKAERLGWPPATPEAAADQPPAKGRSRRATK